MRSRLILALLGMVAVLAIAGCPRDDGSKDTGANPPPKTVTETPKPAAPPAMPANMPPPGTTPPGTTPPGTTPPGTTPPGTTPPGTTPPGTTPPDTTSGGATTPPGETPPATTPPATPAGGTTVVVLETTKGNIELTVHDEWAPIGAKHFLELVNAKFYDGAPWFRVIDVPGSTRPFVAQCGVAADPKLNEEWAPKTIVDEPVKKGNLPGTVCFGKSGRPNSRSTHIFVNLGDNTSSLDPQDFACFAEVTKGMDVAAKLTKVEYRDQTKLSMPGGMEDFRKSFPNADYIKKAYVKK